MSPHGVTSVRLRRPNGPHTLPAVRKGRPLTAVALLTLAAVGAGCSGHPESATPTERGTSSVPATVSSTLNTASTTSGTIGAPGTTTGTTPKFSPEQQEVMAAHDRAMAAYQRAASSSDPFQAEFKSSFTPDALRELQIRIQQRKDNGLSVRDAEPSVARITYLTVDVSGADANLSTCEVDDRVVYKVADGSVLNAKVSTSRWTVRMSYADGIWRIANRQQDGTWDGEEMATCVGAKQS